MFIINIDVDIRITPAGAGKTPHSAIIRVRCRDHPRRCGENKLSDRPWTHRGGSPPQVRGKLRYIVQRIMRTRITPAGAGKTWDVPEAARQPWDHPRRCGENALITGIADDAPGSPPQVRGKLYHHCPYMSIFRITPAGAGKTKLPVCSYEPLQDHPRRCGENRSAVV